MVQKNIRTPESCGTLLSTHSPTAKRGEGGGVSHQRGPPPKGGIYIGAARRRTSPIGQPTKRKASYWAG